MLRACRVSRSKKEQREQLIHAAHIPPCVDSAQDRRAIPDRDRLTLVTAALNCSAALIGSLYVFQQEGHWYNRSQFGSGGVVALVNER